MDEKKRYTVGVLVSGIMDEFTKSICTGVRTEAEKLDVNIVIFPGKFYMRDLSGDAELKYEYQYNTLFRYPTAGNLDALIISAGSMGCYCNRQNMTDLLEHYKGIPCLLISYDIEGYLSVNFDNYKGIKDGLEFMIHHSGCRHFGMIGGNPENTDALERKETFYQVLHEHGYQDDEIVYVQGDFSRRCTSAYCEILDEYPEIDAVFCANDETAIGFYEEVKKRGLRIGEDISILGYDDTLPAALADPPLATVRADSWKLGEEAMKVIIDMLSGKETESKRLTTSFIKRTSVYDAKQNKEHKEKFDATFESIFYRFIHEENKEEIKHVQDIYDNLYQIYQRIIEQNGCREEDGAELDEVFEELLLSEALKYADIDSILTIYEQVYAACLKKFSMDSRMKLLNLFFQGSIKLTTALNKESGLVLKKSENDRHQMKLFVQKLLQFEKGSDASYGMLMQNMAWLGITQAALYIFESPRIHLDKEIYEPPVGMLLKAVLSGENKVKVLPAYRQYVRLDEIFENEFFKPDNRTDRVVLPLFSNELLYGVFVCNLSEQIYENGEFLINQLSCAVKVIRLLYTNEAIQFQLEENLRALEEHNVKLDNLSKCDVLTGIYNRRGFYEEAENWLAQLKSEGKDMLVLYVDMNNLKIINDRYGHNEGDEALKMIGRYLQTWVKDKGITGRIGGDEYVCILEYYGGSETIEHTVEQIYRIFENYNAASDKPYNLTVSAGGYVLKPDDKLGLSEALQKADERMYHEKLKRKKEVAKG